MGIPVHTFTVGNATVTQLTELDVWPIVPRLWYPTISESQLDAARQLFAPSAITDDAGTMLFAIHNYIIEIDGTVIQPGDLDDHLHAGSAMLRQRRLVGQREPIIQLHTFVGYLARSQRFSCTSCSSRH